LLGTRKYTGQIWETVNFL